MRRTEALEAMLQGLVVRAVDPMYKTKQKHGGTHYFRYNRESEQVEYASNRRSWHRSKNAFWTCCFEFEALEMTEPEGES